MRAGFDPPASVLLPEGHPRQLPQYADHLTHARERFAFVVQMPERSTHVEVRVMAADATQRRERFPAAVQIGTIPDMTLENVRDVGGREKPAGEAAKNGRGFGQLKSLLAHGGGEPEYQRKTAPTQFACRGVRPQRRVRLAPPNVPSRRDQSWTELDLVLGKPIVPRR